MDSIFMNSKISKTSVPHGLLLHLSEKLNLKRGYKYVALSNLSIRILYISYTYKNIKQSYNKNKFKISAPTWTEKLELPNRSYAVSDNENYLEFIITKHDKKD